MYSDVHYRGAEAMAMTCHWDISTKAESPARLIGLSQQNWNDEAAQSPDICRLSAGLARGPGTDLPHSLSITLSLSTPYERGRGKLPPMYICTPISSLRATS